MYYLMRFESFLFATLVCFAYITNNFSNAVQLGLHAKQSARSLLAVRGSLRQSANKMQIPSACKGPKRFDPKYGDKLICSGHGRCIGLGDYQEKKKTKCFCECGPGPDYPSVEDGWIGKYCDVDIRRSMRVKFPCSKMQLDYISLARITIELNCAQYRLIWQVCLYLFSSNLKCLSQFSLFWIYIFLIILLKYSRNTFLTIWSFVEFGQPHV